MSFVKQNEMLCKIKEYQFSIIELALYLDTHPEDEKALCLHRHYANILKELMDKYDVYLPIVDTSRYNTIIYEVEPERCIKRKILQKKEVFKLLSVFCEHKLKYFYSTIISAILTT